MIILIILIILVLLSFNLFRNLFKSDVTILDDVKLKEEEVNNNGFALMLETKNADGTTSYVESNSSTWPTDMKFNSELSGCIDVNGNKIENALSFNTSTNAVMVSTNKTAYCYVYFDLKHILADEIMNNPGTGFNTTLEGGLYRYQGTSVDNYICFGTADKSVCTDSPTAYMYRIIGIRDNKQIKVIKEERTPVGYAWNNNGSRTNTSWPESSLFAYLNGNDYLFNETYIPTEWVEKIEEILWKYGDITDANKTASELYVVENSLANTKLAKIGLMYIHDYYFAYQSGGLNCSSSENYSTCKTAWISVPTEWTMSRFGSNSNRYYFAWYIASNGGISMDDVNESYSVRPVFFLASNVEYLSGIGTITDPYIIKE